MAASKGLTPKEQLFVLHYLGDAEHNAKRAYIRAGYDATGRSATVGGSKLLHKPRVAKAIAAGLAKHLGKLDCDAERTLQELTRLATSDMRQAVKYDKDGNLSYVASEDLDDATAAAIQSVEPTRNGLRIKLHDKLQALNTLARHHKLLTDHLDLTTAGEPIRVVEVIRPVAALPAAE